LSKTTLILVRHGATQANVCRPHRLQGLRPDSELIAQGRQQARAVRESLRDRTVAAVYSSPLKRAKETAEIVAEPHGLPVEIEENTLEADVGLWTDLSWPEIEQRWPEECRAFHSDPERHGYLGGENLAQVQARALPAVQGLIARHHGEALVVVSHGAVNRVLLAHWLGMGISAARTIPQENAAINLVEFQGGEAKVRTVNSISRPADVLAGVG
jgi:broad specificity phosphatase PhoE